MDMGQESKRKKNKKKKIRFFFFLEKQAFCIRLTHPKRSNGQTPDLGKVSITLSKKPGLQGMCSGESPSTPSTWEEKQIVLIFLSPIVWENLWVYRFLFSVTTNSKYSVFHLSSTVKVIRYAWAGLDCSYLGTIAKVISSCKGLEQTYITAILAA